MFKNYLKIAFRSLNKNRVYAVINILGFERFLENPIFGEGLGNTIQFQLFENTHVTFPDNSFLYFLWKGGIIGLFLFIWLLVRTFRAISYIIKYTPSYRLRIFMYGISAGIIGFIAFGFLQANFIAFKILIVFTVVLSFVGFEYENLKESLNLKSDE